MLVASTLAVAGLAAGCGAGGVGGGSSGGGSSSGSGSNSSGTITIGTLYAQSGQFSTASMSEYEGLKFWAHEVNANGGVFVKAAGKKEKVKLVAYNDQSSTQTATTLYSRLITQNNVNMLVADFGSVLTSVAVPLAQEHHVLLWDQSGSGTTFFDGKPPNKYIVLTSIQSSGLWPDSLSKFILKNKLKVAVLYDDNDFTGAQDQTLLANLKAGGDSPVYNHPVPTTTSSYSALLTSIASHHPQMVIELGYDTNDIAFMQALQAGSYKFPKVFTIFPGQEEALFRKDVGNKDLANTYTYLAPPLVNPSNINYGMSLSQFESKFAGFSGSNAIDFEDIMGYNTGLILQKDLSVASSLKQTALRQAANTFSGKVTTIEGTFKIDPNTGAQEGLPFPIGQFQVNNGKLSVKDYAYTIKGEL